MSTTTEKQVATKGVILHTHEVRRLLDAGEACIVRPMTPQPSEAAQWDVIHPSHTRKHPAPYLDSYCSAKKTDANPRGMSAHWCWWTPDDRQGGDWIKCPLGAPGDSRWVRETWGYTVLYKAVYKADFNPRHPFLPRWRSSIQLARHNSRLAITTEVVQCKRIQILTRDEAQDAYDSGKFNDFEDWAHGCAPGGSQIEKWYERFAIEWDRRHKKTPWTSNPWVWVCAVKASGK